MAGASPRSGPRGSPSARTPSPRGLRGLRHEAMKTALQDAEPQAWAEFQDVAGEMYGSAPAGHFETPQQHKVFDRGERHGTPGMTDDEGRYTPMERPFEDLSRSRSAGHGIDTYEVGKVQRDWHPGPSARKGIWDPTVKRNPRPFVPAGATQRPAHQALDVHLRRVAGKSDHIVQPPQVPHPYERHNSPDHAQSFDRAQSPHVYSDNPHERPPPVLLDAGVEKARVVTPAFQEHLFREKPLPSAKRKELKEQKQALEAKWRAEEEKKRKKSPPRPFCPAGAQPRPYHKALDKHYEVVRSPSKALAAAQAFGGAGPETWHPKKAVGEEQLAAAARLAAAQHRNIRGTPSRPSDKAWENSPFRQLLLEATTKPKEELNNKRPFIPAGAPLRPAIRALEQQHHQLQVAQRGPPGPSPEPYDAQKVSADVREALGKAIGNALSPPKEWEREASPSPPHFGSAPISPRSPVSEAPTVGVPEKRSVMKEIMSYRPDVVPESPAELEAAAGRAGGKARFMTEEAKIAKAKADRQTAEKHAGDLAMSIGYDGDLGPVKKMLH